jgi:hypothetical protein
MARGGLQGLDKVIRNLNMEIGRIEGASMAGLWDAGLQIQAASQRRVPVDLGNLKGSHYTRNAANLERLQDPPDNAVAPLPSGSVAENMVEIGATADYAIHVHENLEAIHPVGEAKFLEHAITENQGKILEIVRRRAKIQ